ncbi:hypothetical protein EMCRGX_G033363 [Ephydatia muelleri]
MIVSSVASRSYLTDTSRHYSDRGISSRDDDDSIVKHKLATTAVREKPSTSAARVVEARARLPRGLC